MFKSKEGIYQQGVNAGFYKYGGGHRVVKFRLEEVVPFRFGQLEYIAALFLGIGGEAQGRGEKQE